MGTMNSVNIATRSSDRVRTLVGASANHAFFQLCLDSANWVVQINANVNFCKALYMGMLLMKSGNFSWHKVQCKTPVQGQLLRRGDSTPEAGELLWLPICFRAQLRALVVNLQSCSWLALSYVLNFLSQYRPMWQLHPPGGTLAKDCSSATIKSQAFSAVCQFLGSFLREWVHFTWCVPRRCVK